MKKNKKLFLGIALASVSLLMVGASMLKAPKNIIRANALSGEGTVDDPIVISTAAELQEVMSNVDSGANDYSGKYLSINNDLSIELTNTTQGKTLRGHLNGNNHTLTLSTSSTGTYVAMFNCVGSAGSVSNITFAGSLSGVGESSSTVCAFNYGGIENIINNCSLSSTAANGYLGGIAASQISSAANMVNCVNNATISGTKYVGGLAGCLRIGTISNCVNKANITGSNTAVAGIAGLIGQKSDAINNAIITDCINEGNISGVGQVGGIAGGLYPQLTCTNCSNYGDISASGNSGAGGIAGYIASAVAASFSFTNCYSSGTVTTAAGWAGGLFGYAASGATGTVTFNNVLSAAKLVCTSATGNLGGFMAGQNANKVTFNLIKCQSVASVSYSGTGNFSTGIGIPATTINTNEDSSLAVNDKDHGVELSSTTIALLRAIREFNCAYDTAMANTVSTGVNNLTADEIDVLSLTVHFGKNDYVNTYYNSALFIDGYLSTHAFASIGITPEKLFNSSTIIIVIAGITVISGLSLMLVFRRKRKLSK